MPKSSGTSSGAWKPSGWSWEREFCESVGLSWDQVCDNNNELEGFENILQWDDSAALEAFKMAKQRYWEKVNGLSCDIPLPSPDLYIDEIDWNSHQQEDCDLPDRNDSSSSEEHKRSYYKRGARGGYRGRRRNISRVTTREHRKPPDRSAPYTENIAVPTGWPDSGQNTSTDAAGWKNQSSTEMIRPMEWNGNRQNVTVTSKDCTQNEANATIVQTGWDDQFGSGCGVKPTGGSGWAIHEKNDANSTGWEQQKDSGWNANPTRGVNCFANENAMETSAGWGNQTEPTKDSTMTTKTGWTDSGNVAGAPIFCGDHVDSGFNTAAGSSGWTSYEEDKYAPVGWGNEKKSGWGSKPIDRTGWTTPDKGTCWESGAGWRSPYIPQEHLVATEWGGQFPEAAQPHYNNHVFMPAQWNSAPQAAQQWQNQHITWNTGAPDAQYQFNSNWRGPPIHSFHQGGVPGWFQPSTYSQGIWHPLNSNQGYWHPQPQYKQAGYPMPNCQYAHRVNNRRNQR